MSMCWWGYDTNKSCWVYLDRDFECNLPDRIDLPLVFVNCSLNESYEVERKHWEEPRFIYERRINEVLPNLELYQLESLKIKQALYKGILSDYEQKNPKIIQRNRTFTLLDPPQSITPVEPTPDQIRTRYAQTYKEHEWQEVLGYVDLMLSIGTRNQGHCNEYITRSNQWHRFPNIRAKNTHEGIDRPLEGITELAYKIVCKLARIENNYGAPLLKSEKY